MRPRSPIASPMLLALVLFASFTLSIAPSAHAQLCGPGVCSAVFRLIDFESLTTGASVEGPLAIDPDLIINSVAWPFSPSCTVGSAAVVEEGNPVPYDAWGAGAGITNGCLNGIRGFADDAQCVLDYDFTFATGVTVSCFSIRILDYGDYFPFGGTTHEVLLTAYDASNTQVDQALLSTAGGPDLAAGDACITQAGAGNVRLSVSGTAIVKVTLRYDAFPDPNVGYDDITFCETVEPTSARSRSWGTLKSIYR
ncbi:MAG: hypothetical protein HOP12_01725 [Candidatus Eisenbacteria bacterium]|uniref:Uncharacterized protein n=1 Tax=Eiseniibacteriota bacterium TaxID=2212470 RepID=A0A849SB19_UNCEI|nr:hypothetical protein [Candidatus Eisenbacteria bacterium]